VAASNAGGAGSVIGDTTTTLMWIDGVNPFHVFHAYIASIVAFLIFGIFGSIQQDKYQRIQRDSSIEIKINIRKIIAVLLIIAGAIISNYLLDFPAFGVWIAIIICSSFCITPWDELNKAIGGAVFLMALVTAASLMPIQDLPKASWVSTFILGFVSSVFDNIPLTKLCLKQGGYDWGVLAYAVGFGGSMLWFGSSAGVALSNEYPETRSVISYIKHGWHVSLAYVVGFFILMGTLGWNPHTSHRKEQNESLSNEVSLYHLKQKTDFFKSSF